jgi:hypothetical protein
LADDNHTNIQTSKSNSSQMQRDFEENMKIKPVNKDEKYLLA